MIYDQVMSSAGSTVTIEPQEKPIGEDGEYRALKALAAFILQPKPPTPTDELEGIANIARELTEARYAALGVTDEQDKMEGFVTSGLDDEAERKLKAPPQGHALLGNIRRDGKPVRVDNVEAHPDLFGFPPAHPAMQTLLGVPLWANGVVRGSLYVTDRNGGEPFTDGDEAVLLTLTRHVSQLIETEWH